MTRVCSLRVTVSLEGCWDEGRESSLTRLANWHVPSASNHKQRRHGGEGSWAVPALPALMETKGAIAHLPVDPIERIHRHVVDPAQLVVEIACHVAELHPAYQLTELVASDNLSPGTGPNPPP